jgi:hypothetical protein
MSVLTRNTLKMGIAMKTFKIVESTSQKAYFQHQRKRSRFCYISCTAIFLEFFLQNFNIFHNVLIARYYDKKMLRQFETWQTKVSLSKTKFQRGE